MHTGKHGTIVGLTGNISAGKSSVLDIFAKLGCDVASADQVAREILQNNEFIRSKVMKFFGTTDRVELADIVFSAPKKRQLLETILHPEITRLLEEKLKYSPANHILVLELPLLYETGWENRVDHVIFVSCPSLIRKKRFHDSRKASIGDFECRDTAQLGESSKLRLASFVVDNSKSLRTTERQVKDILEKIKNPENL